MTEETSPIWKALFAARAQMGPALKTAKNQHLKTSYADLGSVMAACSPALRDHELLVVQVPRQTPEGHLLQTQIYHIPSGDGTEFDVPLIMAKADMQAYGSALTYARRYAMLLLCDLVPEDDDGHATTAQPPRREEPKREQRRENPAAAGVRDAWTAGVLDSLPADASPRDRARAFADAIIADFDVKKVETLAGRWDRHANLLKRLEAEYPDIWSEVADAYEVRLNELSDEQGAAA